MLSNEETIKWLRKNRMDEDNDINLSGLNFEDDKVYLSGIKAKCIYNFGQEAEESIENDCQKANGFITNEEQEANDSISNESQKANKIYN